MGRSRALGGRLIHLRGEALAEEEAAEVIAAAKTAGKTVPFVEMTVAHASVLTILAISFERYYAICEPLRAGYVCTKARAAGLCGLAWLLAAVLTSPLILMADYRFELYVDGSRVPVCLTQADSPPKALFFVASIAFFFALPLLLLVALYAAIARRLSALPGAASAAPAPVSRRALRHRKQVVLMLGTVVLAFFICLLPFRALTLWIITAPDETLHDLSFECYFNILSFCRAMMYLNSAVNPILYNLMSSKFRAGFLRLVTGRGGRAGGRRGLRAARAASASASLRRRSTLCAATGSSSLTGSASRSRSRSSRARRCSGGAEGGGGGSGEESRLLRRSTGPGAGTTASASGAVQGAPGAGRAGGRPHACPAPSLAPARGESFV